MRWSRALLIPHIIRLSRRAPRDASIRWDRYWAGIEDTGDDGDVLWDSSSSDEGRHYLDLLSDHADPGLPMIDVGCGNGRFTRALAARFPRAIGVDLAESAIVRARHETAPTPNVDFRIADLTEPGAGTRLAGELGDCNVFIRGVLHTLARPSRRRMASNVNDILGSRGTALIAETNYPGPLLGYLENLGASPTGLPHPLARAVSAGLPRPSSFGDAELDDAFPPAVWDRVLTDHRARIATVPMRRPGSADSIPGHVAVLRPHRTES